MIIFSRLCQLFILCLCCCACRWEPLGHHEKLQHFSTELYQQLSVATNIQFYNSHLFNSSLEVKQPVYTWIPLLGFEFFSAKDNNSGHKNYACLYFRVPKADKSGGDLRLMNQSEEQCQGVHVGTLIAELIEVTELRLYYASDDKTKKQLAPKQIPFTLSSLYLKFNYLKESVHLDIPMINIHLNPEVGTEEKKTIDSIFLWGHLEKAKQDAKPMGNESDNYLDHTAKACHMMDQKCNETIPFQCGRCLYGWYETVVDNNCPQGGNKYCGQDRCGQRSQPSCPNSLISSGFCQPGLEAHLDGNQVYVCL